MEHEEHVTVVPAMVGLMPVAAHDAALDAQLLAVDQDPSHSPSVAGVVIAQDPAPGSRVAPGYRVRIWVDTDRGGGGGGVPPVSSGPPPLTQTGTK